MALFDFLRKKQPKQNEEIADFVNMGNETLVKILDGKEGKKILARWHGFEPVTVTLSEPVTASLWRFYSY